MVLSSYLTFFRLTEYPWTLAADPRYHWRSHQADRVLTRMRRALLLHAGFVMLTGAPGTGKTLLSRVLAADMAEEGNRHRFVWLDATSGLTPRALWSEVAAALEIRNPPRSRTELANQVRSALEAQAAENAGLTVVVDEAQLLPRETFLELKRLTNMETTHKLANVLLVGQPDLLRRLRRPGLAAIASRIALSAQVPGLRADDVGPYLRHRLQVAGLNEMPFTREAVAILGRASRFNPRRLNILADLCMMESYRRRERIISGDAAAVAAETMQEELPSPVR